MRPTRRRIWITAAFIVFNILLLQRENLVQGDYASLIGGTLIAALVGYLAAPALEIAWANRDRTNRRAHLLVLAAGGLTAISCAAVYPWITGQDLDHWTSLLVVIVVGTGVDLLIRILRRARTPAQ